jgi:FkbM family methyltransferase
MSKYAYRGARLRWHLRTGVFIELANPIEWILYNEIFADGEYDVPLTKLFERKTDRPLMVADLGANVGFFSLRLAHLAAAHSFKNQVRVEGIEGSRSLCDVARQRWSACRFETCKVGFNVTHGLVGKRSGTAELFHHYHHGANSMFLKHKHGDVVSYLDLSAHFARVECIDLLKCDIEGAEQLFFETYPDVLRKTHAVVVEFHPMFCDPAICINLLQDAGFTEHRVLGKERGCSVEYFGKHESCALPGSVSPEAT